MSTSVEPLHPRDRDAQETVTRLTYRVAAGHARHADPADARLGAALRIRHRPDDPGQLPQPAPGRYRLALSPSPPICAARRHRRRVGDVREQSARSHIPPHGRGATSIVGRTIEVETT